MRTLLCFGNNIHMCSVFCSISCSKDLVYKIQGNISSRFINLNSFHYHDKQDQQTCYNTNIFSVVKDNVAVNTSTLSLSRWCMVVRQFKQSYYRFSNMFIILIGFFWARYLVIYWRLQKVELYTTVLMSPILLWTVINLPYGYRISN